MWNATKQAEGDCWNFRGYTLCGALDSKYIYMSCKIYGAIEAHSMLHSHSLFFSVFNVVNALIHAF